MRTVVTERYGPSHPHALALGGSDLVANPLTRYLAFELREGEQNIEGQPSHRSRGVELLGDGYHRDSACFQSFHDLGKVRKAASQAIDLIDHDSVDLVCLNIIEQTLQRWPRSEEHTSEL